MGFFDRLKSAANMVTGGGATVSVEIGPVAVGVPIPVVIRAQVAGAAISPSRVYLGVRAVETVDLIHRDRDGGRNDRDRVHDTETTFSQEFVVSGAASLPANSSHQWHGQFVIPPSAQPTYRGKHAKHEWSVMAGLDVTGNDPDSGWVVIEVR